MRDLRETRQDTRLAFDRRFFAQTTGTSYRYQRNYLAAYWMESEQEVRDVEAIVADGPRQLEVGSGFKSRTFTAFNYVCPSESEPFLASEGIGLIQAQCGNVQPLPSRGGDHQIRCVYTSRKNHSGEIYSVRKVLFELYGEPSLDWAGKALQQVRASFQFGKPPVISTHRINHTSTMDTKHRDRSLHMLDQFLESIRETWGMSSC